MNYISDVLFWISNGLLVPVVVLLILFFLRSLLLIGNFFGQYLQIRKVDRLFMGKVEALTPETAGELLCCAVWPVCWMLRRTRLTGSCCSPTMR